MNKLRKFLAERTVGYVLSATAALCAFVVAAIYGACFWTDAERFSFVAFLLPLVGGVAFTALGIFRPTAPFAPAVLAVCLYVALLQFLSHQVIYLSDVFYGGVTAAAISSLDGGFSACFFLLLLGGGLSVSGIFMKMYRRAEDE